jgi:tetratricopeptide (TPR) repeat protein
MLAEKAIIRGPAEFENHWSLAFACLYSRDFARTGAAFDRAMQLNPNCPDMLIDIADEFVFTGRLNEAIHNVERAMRLNPIYPDSYMWTMGTALYHCGQYDAAAAALSRIAQPPNLVRRHLAATYVRLGEVDKAREVAAEFLRNDPEYTLDRENIWPYKDARVAEAFLADLRDAGLPG